jgi:hypothetical protein
MMQSLMQLQHYLVQKIVDGFTYDPGHSDLDDEQPVYISMTLGDYRQAVRVLHYLEET